MYLRADKLVPKRVMNLAGLKIQRNRVWNLWKFIQDFEFEKQTVWVPKKYQQLSDLQLSNSRS